MRCRACATCATSAGAGACPRCRDRDRGRRRTAAPSPVVRKMPTAEVTVVADHCGCSAIGRIPFRTGTGCAKFFLRQSLACTTCEPRWHGTPRGEDCHGRSYQFSAGRRRRGSGVAGIFVKRCGGIKGPRQSTSESASSWLIVEVETLVRG